MKSVMVIYGTRPEAIKVAPLVLALQSNRHIAVRTTVTGQHREMLDQVNEVFGIEPDHDLDLMVPGATLADLASRVLQRVAGVLADERPDAVVVQGDTSTAFISALAAFYASKFRSFTWRPACAPATCIRPSRKRRIDSWSVASRHCTSRRPQRPEATSWRKGLTERRSQSPATRSLTLSRAPSSKPVRFSDDALAQLVVEWRALCARDGPPARVLGRSDAAGNGCGSGAERWRTSSLHWVVPMHRNPIVRSVIETALRRPDERLPHRAAGLSRVLSRHAALLGFC